MEVGLQEAKILLREAQRDAGFDPSQVTEAPPLESAPPKVREEHRVNEDRIKELRKEIHEAPNTKEADKRTRELEEKLARQDQIIADNFALPPKLQAQMIEAMAEGGAWRKGKNGVLLHMGGELAIPPNVVKIRQDAEGLVGWNLIIKEGDDWRPAGRFDTKVHA